VAAFDVDAARLALAREFGASAAYNPAEPGFEALLQPLEGTFDTVVDASGAAAGFALSNRLVRRAGRINQFGWVHGPLTASGDDWHLRGISLVNSSPAARLRDPFPVAIRWIAAGKVDTRPLVTHVVPLHEMSNLLASVTRGQEQGYIKGVVTLEDA